MGWILWFIQSYLLPCIKLSYLLSTLIFGMNELSHLDIEDHLWDYSPTCIGLGLKTINWTIGRSLLLFLGHHISNKIYTYYKYITNYINGFEGPNSYYKGVKC
jgi:hypothetical protein